MRTVQASLFAAGLGVVIGSAWGQTLRIEGSSAGQALATAAVAEFRRGPAANLQVSFGVNGTGAAFSKLCRNEIDAVVATRPIVTQELERCQFAGVTFVEAPLAFDAVVVVVNLRNSYLMNLPLNTLRTLWSENSEGKLLRWDQLDASLPKLPVKLYGPVALSEGASYFNEAVLAGREGRRDYTSSVDESVLVRAVARDDESLGYVSLSTYLDNRGRLKAVSIVEAGTDAVLPSAETVAQGRYRTLSRPIFLYVRVKALTDSALREFTDYWMANGARIAQQAKLVPLSAATYAGGYQRVSKLVEGSVWGGSITVGATLQDVERRQAGK